jgi:hypothetical protein
VQVRQPRSPLPNSGGKTQIWTRNGRQSGLKPTALRLRRFALV